MKRGKKQKQTTLLSQIIAIHFEEAKRRKAVRLLEKQVWSLDFLTAVVLKANRLSGEDIELTLENSNGHKITIGKARHTPLQESILDKLDDEAAVLEFIKQNSTRGKQTSD